MLPYVQVTKLFDQYENNQMLYIKPILNGSEAVQAAHGG